MSTRSVLVAAAVFVTVATEAHAFGASFRWCSGTPEFTLSAVPKGTTSLRFRMTDLQVPSYPHGGGTVAYAGGSKIPCGAIQGSYQGPSPPPPQIHTYRWTIEAMDASGKVLGTAAASRKFPEK